MEDDDVSEIMARFEGAAIDAVQRISPVWLRQLADLVERGASWSEILRCSPTADYQESAQRIWNALWELDDFSAQAAAAYLRGVAAGYECNGNRITAPPAQSTS
ncbi:hypothetical protein AB0M95_33560 [Sphaerisporangium sp. NPDC051017]|uniref:hypothetical protein n=1 Tax=Sphaerisporangium sp. NPDC051017 TaxID=3154636 RepID=UPI003427ACBE